MSRQYNLYEMELNTLLLESRRKRRNGEHAIDSIHSRRARVQHSRRCPDTPFPYLELFQTDRCHHNSQLHAVDTGRGIIAIQQLTLDRKQGKIRQKRASSPCPPRGLRSRWPGRISRVRPRGQRVLRCRPRDRRALGKALSCVSTKFPASATQRFLHGTMIIPSRCGNECIDVCVVAV